MFSPRRTLLILIPALALLGACSGGDDDDADDSGRDSDGTSATPTTTRDDADRFSNGDVDIPAIKDGAFADGEVHVEVSGDKDLKVDLEGDGYTAGGWMLLTFASEEAVVVLTFNAGSKDEPGGLSVTHPALATAGAWRDECTVTIDEDAREVSGEFECRDLDAIQPGTANTYDVRIKGNFSVTR